MLNIVVIQGNLTSDPIVGKTKSGASVLNVRLACKRDFRHSDRDADFVRITFWGPLAEYVGKHYKKGDNITVHGRLEEILRPSYDGNTYSSIEIRAEEIYAGVTSEMRRAMVETHHGEKNKFW